MDRKPLWKWKAYVKKGKTRSERRERLEAAPIEFQGQIRTHLEQVYLARKNPPKRCANT